jgi:hypothetical protein
MSPDVSSYPTRRYNRSSPRSSELRISICSIILPHHRSFPVHKPTDARSNITVIMSTLVDPISVPNLDTVKIEEKPSADGGEQVATHGDKPSIEQADSTISTPELVNAGSVPSEVDNGEDEAETSSVLSFAASDVPAVLDTRAVVEDGSEIESLDGSVKGVNDDASGVEVMSAASDSGETGEAETE